MQVDLDPQLAAIVRERVQSGLYPDEGDVVREALWLLAERDRLNELRTSLIEANAQIDRGEFVLWTPEVLEELSREADELARQGAMPPPDVWPSTAGFTRPTRTWLAELGASW